MATQTPNYSFELPEPGADNDLWGDFLNANWSFSDTLLKALEDRIAAVEQAANDLAEDLKVPIGGLYLSTTDTDPATTLKYGTWAPYAEGRAIVGAGNNGTSDWTPGLERGEETHQLVAAEVPAHTHAVNPPETTTNTTGSHTHGLNREGRGSGGTQAVNNGGTEVQTGAAGDHSHTVNIPEFDSSPAGGDQPHNNVQPSIATYVWLRTA